MNPEHSSKTAEHYTPPYIIDIARNTMGSIDLDPASCADAQETVRARCWITKEQDALRVGWPEVAPFNQVNVWLNPPGDKSGSLPKAFFGRLAHYTLASFVKQFCYLAFNISHLKTCQKANKSIMESCWLGVFEKRIEFTGTQPTKDNAMLYYGPKGERFAELFKPYGAVWAPKYLLPSWC